MASRLVASDEGALGTNPAEMKDTFSRTYG
jgi:hypothetical protein